MTIPKKKVVVIGIVLVALVGQILVWDLMQRSAYRDFYSRVGKMVYTKDATGEERWGFQIERGFIIKTKKIIFFDGLPQRLQKEGLKARIVYSQDQAKLISTTVLK